jgi:hypothetical protein
LKCECNKFIFPRQLCKTIENYELYKNSILKQIELKNFDIIQTKKSELAIIKKIRDTRMTRKLQFPKCIQFTINSCYKSEFEKIKIKIEKNNDKINYTTICSYNWCDGNVINNKCNLCDADHCQKCKELKKINHKCNEDTISSLKVISQFHKCPKCELPIEKSSGCSYLTCAVCNTKFDHTTNEISTHGGHSIQVSVSTKTNLSDDPQFLENLTEKHIIQLKIIEKSVLFKNDTNCIVKSFLTNESDKTLLLYEVFLYKLNNYKINIKKMRDLYNNKHNQEIVKQLLKN